MNGPLARTTVPRVLLVAAVTSLAACETAFQRIDRRTSELLAGANARLGDETVTPRLGWEPGSTPSRAGGDDPYQRDPGTTNPSSRELTFAPAGEADDVLERLERYAASPADAVELDLISALEYAIARSREYRFAEEDYVLEGLRLLSERHLWGPRIFNDTSLEVTALGDNSTYDTALRLVNDLRVTQRLPYGGEISAQLLARATEDLHLRVLEENVQTAELIFAADVPLLRGAGMVAREDLIQAERNVVYAARRFERFRREFLVDITTDFLDLVIQQQEIDNSVANVEMLRGFQEREEALVTAGRQEPFQAALAAQSTLFAEDRLNDQREVYRLTLDRFKVRLGMPEDQTLVIVPSAPGLSPPEVSLDQAVQAALSYRLDLQNRRDLIDDSRRGVEIARNALLADLDLAASVSVPTDDDKDRAGLDLAFDDPVLRASLVLGLPIDRTVERLALRQSQIDLERSLREYDRFRDSVAVEVRAAVRNIDRALFSMQLQEENVRVARLRLASIEAAPDRASARDRSEAASDLLDAQNDYLRAVRDLQVAILRYLLDSGQLRVDHDGTIRPLEGMKLAEDEPFEPRVVPRGAGFDS